MTTRQTYVSSHLDHTQYSQWVASGMAVANGRGRRTGRGGGVSQPYRDRGIKSHGEGAKMLRAGLTGTDSASDSVVGEQSHVMGWQGRFAV
jgi:hypothetical protein